MPVTLMNVMNSAQSTLQANISPTDTSLTLVNATGFPTAPFRITIDAEVIQVGAINVGTRVLSSLTRGVEGTAGASHLAGASVENRWTAGQYDLLKTAITESRTYAP